MSSHQYPCALTIAGSDSCGGAGLQADIKAFTVLKVYGMSVVTAITAQNTLGVQSAMELPLEIVSAQLSSVLSDIAPSAIKTGMLASAATIELVASRLADLRCPYVCDPVMVAKSGDSLISADAIGAYRAKLLPLATVITPNRLEVMRLLGQSSPIQTLEEGREAARRLSALGPRHVVVKGISRGEQIVDLLWDGAEFREFAGERHSAGRFHGSGCTFSAAVTAMLARGSSVAQAVETARKVIDAAIACSFPDCQGIHPVNVMSYSA